MALFNYSNCHCKKIRCENVGAIANILPVNVCNIINDYSKMDCFKCRCLKLKEMYFMKDKDLPEEGLEKAELQLLFFKQSFNNYITQMTGQHYDDKQYRRNIDNIFDKLGVKERFKNRKMYYQAMKSYCKNNSHEVRLILRKCIKIEQLSFMKNNDFNFPNLNSWWSYRNNNYYMRHILSNLIEIYTDQLTEGYEHYCCEYSMSCYSGCIVGEIEYGTN